MIGEPRPDMGGQKTPEVEKELTAEDREMLWDDAMHYLEVLRNKVKGMKEVVVNQKELEGMSIEYYLNDIETDAASMASLFGDLKKNKFPKLEE